MKPKSGKEQTRDATMKRIIETPMKVSSKIVRAKAIREALVSALHDKGYYVFPTVGFRVTAKEKEQIKADLTAKNDPINQRIDPENEELKEEVAVGDGKRLTGVTRTMKNRSKQILFQYRKWVQKLLPGHTVKAPAYLYSLDECEEQDPHFDGNPFLESWRQLQRNQTPLSRVPLSCILALEDKTELVVWPKSFKLTYEFNPSAPTQNEKEVCEREVVPIPKGSMIVFRQDLTHAGSAYAKDNLRIFAYADLEKFPRQSKSTFFSSSIKSWLK